MATNLSDIRSTVRDRYESNSTVRLSDDRLDAAINDGVEELSERTEAFESYVVVPVKSGRTYYDIRNFLPDEAIKVTSVWLPSENWWLEYMPPRKFTWREWERTNGASRNWFMRGLFHLGVFPHLAANTGVMHVYFKHIHPPLSNTWSEIYVPEDFVEAVEEYALYDLYAQDRETGKALLHWAGFVERAKPLRDLVERRGKRPRAGRMANRGGAR